MDENEKLRAENRRLSQALDCASSYITDIQGPAPGGLLKWREWWLQCVDSSKVKEDESNAIT